MIKNKDFVIAKKTLLVTGVTIVNMHFMAFQIAVLAIVTWKDPEMTLVKMENAFAPTKQLLVINVTNVQLNTMISQVANLVNVPLKAVLTQNAMFVLEIVTVNQM